MVCCAHYDLNKPEIIACGVADPRFRDVVDEQMLALGHLQT